MIPAESEQAASRADPQLDRPNRTPEEIATRTAAAIELANRRIEDSLGAGEASFETLFGALDDAARIVFSAYGDGPYLRLVAPDDDGREAAEQANAEIEKWRAGLAQREDVAAAVTRFVAETDPATLDPDEAAFVRRWETDVRLAGAALPPEQREEVRRLTTRLIELQTTFQANLIKVPHIELTAEELDGVPAAVLATLEPGSSAGTLDVPINEAVGLAIFERARRRDVRERVDRIRLNRGMPDNIDILEEVLEVRRTIARLLGYRSWHALRIENLAAPDVATIERFIEDMAARLEPIVRSQLEAMRQVLLAEPGAPADLSVEDWDWRYVDKQQRSASGLNTEELEPYLDLDVVFGGLVALSEEVFGIRLVEHPERVGWHPDVRGFDLVDRDSGDVLTRMFFDPYVRPGKAGGAFADVLDPGDPSPAGHRPPTIALVMNAPVRSDGASLLSTWDVDTVFHEFGHVLDFGLSKDRFATLRPEGWIRFDWVEGPSSFLGRWAVTPSVLTRFARHHRTGEPLPAALVEPLHRLDSLNAALEMRRILSMSRLDVLLHAEEPMAIDEANRLAWSLRGTPLVEGTSFPASLSHLIANYDGALYGYAWATVLADDLLSRFEREGMTSPAVGSAYRRTILEASWLRDPLAGHAEFLGRPWSADAYVSRIEAAG
jgi:Zn-dependent oligopeptidase